MTSWATFYVQALKQGQEVAFRPKGNSMTPLIKSGQLCRVSPDVSDLHIDDIVLCKVRHYYLHKIVAVGSDGRYLIGNNRGYQNGWITKDNIFGKLVSVSP